MMTDGLFSMVGLSDTPRAGYRLQYTEVFNWGTFDSQVWRLTPDTETALLTGDIGSGKSTIVDALTTLLMPSHKAAYNRAAGADAKERTLRSYVEGHYKSERNEVTGRSRAKGLRENKRTYSVVLGVFVNHGYDETVTLAQVFQQRESTGQPYRFSSPRRKRSRSQRISPTSARTCATSARGCALPEPRSSTSSPSTQRRCVACWESDPTKRSSCSTRPSR